MKLITGDCVEAMREMDEASVDAVVCDPPYGLEFMGKEWDRLSGGEDVRQPFRGEVQTPDNPFGRTPVRYPYNASGRLSQDWHQAWATEALRVLRPGGHLLAFGGTRTYHRLACAIEDAGFEIRDCLAWLYGSGFPKSHNLDGDWNGWGTALKPAHEPIVLARKSLIGTVAANVSEHGTGALNVDGCRVGVSEKERAAVEGREWVAEKLDRNAYGDYAHDGGRREIGYAPGGRWPANVTLDPEAAAMLDEQSGERPGGNYPERRGDGVATGFGRGLPTEGGARAMGDTGGASRFFYTAKASRGERNAGLEGFPDDERRGQSAWGRTCKVCGDTFVNPVTGEPRCGHGDFAWTPTKPTKNHHPTVKPIALMRWLCRLVTPPGGTILDPFLGSGTTGCAAVLEGFEFVGIERESEYAEIARARIEWWVDKRGEVEEILTAAAESERVTERLDKMGQLSLD